jgi:hypothetical protein
MAEIHGPKIVRDGLILSLDAGDINSYPSSGTSVYDLSGNSYTFTLEGNATYSSQGRGSIYLDGSADGIQRTSTAGLQSAVTLVQWLKTSDTVGLMLSGEVVGTGGNYYVGAYYPGQGFYNSNCGSPSFYIDTKLTTNPATPINYLDHAVKSKFGAPLFEVYRTDGLFKSKTLNAYASFLAIIASLLFLLLLFLFLDY